MASLFGGRVAEELIFGADSVTTGASNDITRATEIARKMVTQWGLSTMGPLTFGQEEGEVFLGRSMSQTKEISDQTAQKIDEEVRKIVDRNFQHAATILQENVKTLHLMAEALIKYETIDANQIKSILAGEEPPAPEGWVDGGSSGSGDSGQTVAPEKAKSSPARKKGLKDHPASEAQ